MYIFKLIFLLFCIFNYSKAYAESSIDYYLKIKSIEKNYDVERMIVFKFIDQRDWQNNKIDLGKLKNELLLLFNKDESTFLLKKTLEVEMKISFMGFYKTESGTWCGRAVMNLFYIDTNRPFLKHNSVLSIDIGFGKKRKIDNEWEEILIKKIVDKIKDKNNEFFEIINKTYKTVVSFGKSEVKSTTDETQKNAVLDALQNGSSKLWGMQITNVSKLINLSDLEEETKRESKGIVLAYKIIPEYTKITDDNYLCLVVEGVISSQTK